MFGSGRCHCNFTGKGSLISRRGAFRRKARSERYPRPQGEEALHEDADISQEVRGQLLSPSPAAYSLLACCGFRVGALDHGKYIRKQCRDCSSICLRTSLPTAVQLSPDLVFYHSDWANCRLTDPPTKRLVLRVCGGIE